MNNDALYKYKNYNIYNFIFITLRPVGIFKQVSSTKRQRQTLLSANLKMPTGRRQMGI